MDITLAAGLLTVTLPDATTQGVAMGSVVDVSAEIAPKFRYGIDSASQVIKTDKYFVRVHLNDNRWLDIPMGEVGNQPTWTNDEAGANTAVSEISAVIPS